MTKEEFAALREKAGMTQEAIADWLGVNVRTAQRYESGEIPIKGPVLKLLLILKERVE
jgi:DNA-binding transcriptional regulator YiaG